MVHTVRHIKPHPLLRKFVAQYTIRKISLDEGETLSKIMPHRTLNSLEFFLSEPYHKFDYQTGEGLNFKRATARGVRTFTKYRICLNKNFVSVTVKFHRTGMYALLGIPIKYFTNEDLELKGLNIIPIDEILDRLFEANENQYVPVLEKYLLDLLKKNNKSSRLAGLHLSPAQFTLNRELTIGKVAEKCNLSVRQTERIFLEEIGLPLKKLNHLHRFDFLIKDKMAHPEKSWTELAHGFGFYDQSDLYKAFKTYLDTTPHRFDASQFAF